MKIIASYIMRGRMQAVIVSSTLAMLSLIVPPSSLFSSGAVALVTLRRGPTEGIYVLLTSSVCTAILSLLLLGSYHFGLIFALAIWLPVWLISVVLREGRQLSLAVEIAVLIGILAVAGFYVFNANPSATWQDVLMQMVPANVDMADVKTKIVQVSHYMTGIFAAATSLSMLLGLFVGRWWQAMLYNPGGFRQEFLTLATRRNVALATLAVLAIANLGSGLTAEVAWNLAIMLFALYVVIGTSVMHTVFASKSLGRYMVPMFYITLFLVPHVLLPVAIVGLTDAWFNSRSKNLK